MRTANAIVADMRMVEAETAQLEAMRRLSEAELEAILAKQGDLRRRSSTLHHELDVLIRSAEAVTT
jgi:hypothetical protein